MSQPPQVGPVLTKRLILRPLDKLRAALSSVEGRQAPLGRPRGRQDERVEGRRGTGRHRLIVLSTLVVLAASFAIDGPLTRAVARHPPSIAPNLFIMFRLAGYVPLWLIVAAALILIDAEAGWRRAWRRGGSLIATVALSGLAAEVLKIVVRRARPGAAGNYVFRSSGDGMFSSSGLGWPSSHAAVAFGAVWVLCFLFPRATLVWLTIGIGCGLTRIAANDHFASDVASAAIIAYLVAIGVRRLTASRPR